MAVSIGDVMRQCRNHFVTDFVDGTFTITGGVLEGIPLVHGQVIAITGSRFNDDVHVVYGTALFDATDETFTGRIWYLSPPRGFMRLCEEIAQYAENAKPGNILSESFGGNYSVTYASQGGAPMGWAGVYSAQLTPYKRMFDDVEDV